MLSLCALSYNQPRNILLSAFAVTNSCCFCTFYNSLVMRMLHINSVGSSASFEQRRGKYAVVALIIKTHHT